MGAEQIRQQQLLQQQQMLQQQQQMQQAGYYNQPQTSQKGHQQQVQPQLSKQQKIEIEGQKTAFKLNSHMTKIDDMIARKMHEAELKEERIKELIVQGKKTQAKQMVGELKQLRTNIENFQTRRKVLSGQVNNIQMATVDASMAHTMGKANEYMKSHEMVNQKLNDIILDQRQIQAQQAQTNHLLNEMAMGEGMNQDQDELFKELEMQVAKEKAAIINQNIPKQHVPQVAVVQQQQQSNYAQQKQVYAPMSTVGGGQQYVTKTSGSTGLTSQYHPQQYAPQYAQQQYQQPQTQYKPTQVNHMDEITRMLNG